MITHAIAKNQVTSPNYLPIFNAIYLTKSTYILEARIKRIRCFLDPLFPLVFSLSNKHIYKSRLSVLHDVIFFIEFVLFKDCFCVAAGIVKKVFWGSITAVCVAILVFHLTSITIYYFRRDVDVSITLVTRRQLTFPAVTVCNMNPVKHSALSNNSALRALLDATDTGCDHELIL